MSHYIAEPNAKFHGPGRDVIQMVGQRSRHGSPQLISINKSILSSTFHRQGAEPAITAETICPAGQSVGLIRGPSHNKSDRLSKCKHMSFYAMSPCNFSIGFHNNKQPLKHSTWGLTMPYVFKCICWNI